jgi:NTE family protein
MGIDRRDQGEDQVSEIGWKPSQIVLVLQGGGALGAYQVGVYQAMHDAGIEPDWVIGTSIGAINGALIAGNPPERRLARLEAFWERLAHSPSYGWLTSLVPGARFLNTLLAGVDSFFVPNPLSLLGLHVPVGVDSSAFYSVEPLRATLGEMIELAELNGQHPRFTVGAVNVRTGAMHYFDSRAMPLSVEHVLASGALPPAFPAVMIAGEPYWDGGVYSNTPAEVVLDDSPRRDSLIFTVNVWQHHGEEPRSIWDVLGREKDIQFSSRVGSHLARQAQIHRGRRIIQELSALLSPEQLADPHIRALTSHGCATTNAYCRLAGAPAPGRGSHQGCRFLRRRHQTPPTGRL